MSTLRRLTVAATFAAVVTVALSTTTGAPAAGAAEQCPRVGGRLTVAVVVDDGASVSTTCVDLPSGATGADALAARARAVGAPSPRYGASGLLCGIDGTPTTGCGAPDGNGAFLYWSYWWGVGSSWQYATRGPAGHRLADGAVEGWRYIRGTGTGTDNAPRRSAAIPFVDPPVPATTPSPPAPPPSAAVPPTVLRPAAAPPTAAPPSSRPAPVPAPASSNAGVTVAPPGPTGPATAPVPSEPQAPAAPDTSTGSPTTTEAVGGRAAATPGVGISSDGSGSWIGTAVGAGAFVATAAGVVLFSRRRSSAGT